MQTLRDEQAAQARGAELRAQNLEKMQSALNKDQELVSRMASEHETKLRAHRERSVQKSRQNSSCVPRSQLTDFGPGSRKQTS